MGDGIIIRFSIQIQKENKYSNLIRVKTYTVLILMNHHVLFDFIIINTIIVINVMVIVIIILPVDTCRCYLHTEPP